MTSALPRAGRFLLLLALCGCASLNSQPDEIAGVLSVENDRTADAAIYIVHSGSPVRRLGDVTGHSAATFVLRHSDLSADNTLQLRAKFLAEGPDVVSPVVLIGGQHPLIHWSLNALRTGEFLWSTS